MIKIAPSILSADYASLGSAVDVLADWGRIMFILMLWTVRLCRISLSAHR